jgi:hypothetical protein
MAWPDAPRRSVATLADLRLASSRTFLEAVGHGGALSDQLGPLPGEVAQLPDRPGRNETGAEQPVLKQLRDPLAVFRVGLAAGDRLDVLRLDDEDRESRLQEVGHRLPVDARRFHGDLGHPASDHPVGQAQQIHGHGPKGTDLLIDPAVGSQPPDAGADGPVGDVQSGAAGDDDLPRSISCWRLVFGNRRTFEDGANGSSCSPDDGGARWGCARSGPDFRAGSKHQSR